MSLLHPSPSPFLRPLFLPLSVALALSAHAGSSTPVAHWTFDEAEGAVARDLASGRHDPVSGYTARLDGVSGHALRLDGYTTGVTRGPTHAPELDKAFTLQAWVALEAYPWGQCPILCQVRLKDLPPVADEGMTAALATEVPPDAGFFFGIDANGHVVLQASLEGKWVTCRSDSKVPLLKWTHVSGILSPDTKTLRILINGVETGSVVTQGSFIPQREEPMVIGRNPKARPPQHPIRLNLPALYAIEGLLDEVKIYASARNDAEVAAEYKATPLPTRAPLAFAPLPQLPARPTRFGAWTTKLAYKDTWDAPRREGPASDVVVRFDEQPWHYVFWRGTNSIPHWVTENGIWYTNEFNETWNNGALGCAEPMSDKQSRFSRVQILEANDARVVVHWRYALVDTRYISPFVDPLSGWGEWSDEYHTIYPDGVGVRRIQLWSSQPQQPHEFQESIVLVPAGKRPEEVIETNAVTLVNLAGDAHTYSWETEPPRQTTLPAKANIELIHTRSRAKPFLIVTDAPFEIYGQRHDSPAFKPFNAEVKRENSIFPWWNHWPVAQIPSDGRWATESDRIAHSSLTTGLEWRDLESTPNSRTRIMLHGLTEGGPEELAQLGRSWLRAPQVKVKDGADVDVRYDESERAYVVTGGPGPSRELVLSVDASDQQPLINPAFIIEDWSPESLDLYIDGQAVPRGREFRHGVRRGLDRDDLIIWISTTRTSPVEVRLVPRAN